MVNEGHPLFYQLALLTAKVSTLRILVGALNKKKFAFQTVSLDGFR